MDYFSQETKERPKHVVLARTDTNTIYLQTPDGKCVHWDGNVCRSSTSYPMLRAKFSSIEDVNNFCAANGFELMSYPSADVFPLPQGLIRDLLKNALAGYLAAQAPSNCETAVQRLHAKAALHNLFKQHGLVLENLPYPIVKDILND